MTQPWLYFLEPQFIKWKMDWKIYLETLIKLGLLTLNRVYVCVFFPTSELAGWIVGVYPTSCSSLITHGTPSILRRLMSNLNSHVSLQLPYFAVSLCCANHEVMMMLLTFNKSLMPLSIQFFPLSLQHGIYINLHVLCVWSVRDGRIHVVSSAAPWAHHRPTALHHCFYFCCSPPSVHWPLRAAPWQTSRRDGNVSRFSNHPLWSSAQSTNLHQGTKKFDQRV